MGQERNFTISAKTCTLKYNIQEGNATILNNNAKYVIPIYQRPYSWTEEQISKFIADIFTSYWGLDGHDEEEAMFIGTMQLTNKNEANEQDIIDGQQRLTTFLIFLKVLKISFPECKELQSIGIDWLSTKVNSGKQQKYLDEVIEGDLSFNDETLNPYLKNAFLIKELFEEHIKDEEGVSLSFDIDKFSKHLLSNIYFVVIETQAGLTKTLQIFNAINTTGLDLNGGDIFKIKMYEYLRDKKGHTDGAFEAVSKLYQTIDENNAILKYNATNISGILSIYQQILIAKYELPTVLYTFGSDTFFERLFDTIFNINQWEHFSKKVSEVELSLDEIKKIIEVRYEWENTAYASCEDACAMHFIWWSRYSRYWNLTFIFLYRYRDEENYWKKMLLFVRQLSKLYTIYSIRFLKSVNQIHNFNYDLIKKILNGSYEEVMQTINEKIGTIENHKGWYDLEEILNKGITYNAKLKNILCRLSAMLEEDYKTTDPKKIEEIRTNIFSKPVDKEHIESYHHSDGSLRNNIWEKWKDDINSLGNLVVLEQTINRSISNKPYKDKIKGYSKSEYKIVSKQIRNYPEWDLPKCKERKGYEVKKILNYIFDKS